MPELASPAPAAGAARPRLAQQVAAELVDQFPDGVWWVDLAAVVDADRVGDVVAAAAPEVSLVTQAMGAAITASASSAATAATSFQPDHTATRNTPTISSSTSVTTTP